MCCGADNGDKVLIKFTGPHWVGDRVRSFPKKIADELTTSGVWVAVEGELEAVKEEVIHVFSKDTKNSSSAPTENTEASTPEEPKPDQTVEVGEPPTTTE